MTYQQTLDFLYNQVPMFQNLGAGAYKPGLDTTMLLAGHWDNPHKKLKAAVHIGGTNGKGSTAHSIAAVLQSAGYKVGLYTSPHLVDFRERIRIDGEMIGKEYVVKFVDEYLSQPELVERHPTFFELTTIMALRYFADREVDVAVIEVGLGGRLDCTNIITPLLSVITNISLDHTALLGHTEAEIASEKAGIIKEGVPVIIGNATGDVRTVFANKATAMNAPIMFVQDKLPFDSVAVMQDCIEYRGTEWGDIRGQLSGDCQKENGATILTALAQLSHHFTHIDADAVKKGFGDVCGITGLMGRWMTVCTHPAKVICDTGHNIGGWQWLAPKLKSLADTLRLAIVIGFVNDKDVEAIMQLMPSNASYFFATPSVKRGRAAEETASIAAAHGLHGAYFGSVKEAYESACTAPCSFDTIFVGGSTFVVADLLAALDIRP